MSCRIVVVAFVAHVVVAGTEPCLLSLSWLQLLRPHRYMLWLGLDLGLGLGLGLCSGLVLRLGLGLGLGQRSVSVSVLASVSAPSSAAVSSSVSPLRCHVRHLSQSLFARGVWQSCRSAGSAAPRARAQCRGRSTELLPCWNTVCAAVRCNANKAQK